MFETKKGFTLIELLATIVILGLLSLIVTPGIAKVIKNSKINTTKASLEGYVREIENASTLYLTDTGVYPDSINQLELDGKNIDKIENTMIELENGEVKKLTVEIDGIHCKYEKGLDTICQEESFYSYMKNNNTYLKETIEILNQYGISLLCYETEVCPADENVILMDNKEEIESKKPILINEDDTFYHNSIKRSEVMSLVFTNIRPEGNYIDISQSQDGEVLLYYSKRENTGYDIKIYSSKPILFPENSSYMFSYLNNIEELDLGTNIVYTNSVKDMSGMFRSTCYDSTSCSINLGNNFDTSNVTSMKNLFLYTGYKDTNFTLDLGDKFDTRNVTNMVTTFASIGFSSQVFQLDLGSKFDTSNVVSMYHMFINVGINNPNFTLDLGNKFDTSKVRNMVQMFKTIGRATPNFTLDLSMFDTSNVIDMTDMFENASSLKTIYVSEKWNTNSVINSTEMFNRCTSLPNFDANVIDKTNAHYGPGGYLTLKTN